MPLASLLVQLYSIHAHSYRLPLGLRLKPNSRCPAFRKLIIEVSPRIISEVGEVDACKREDFCKTIIHISMTIC
jgi:hypothetical protein